MSRRTARKNARKQDPLLSQYTRYAALFGDDAGTVLFTHKQDDDTTIRLRPTPGGFTVEVDTDDGVYRLPQRAYPDETQALRAAHDYAFGGA